MVQAEVNIPIFLRHDCFVDGFLKYTLNFDTPTMQRRNTCKCLIKEYNDKSYVEADLSQ